MDEHTQKTISEQLYYTLNPFKDNWYEIFAALNEADSTLLTQNSIRQEDTAEAIIYRLGTVEIGRYDKITQKYSILDKNISIKETKKRYADGKRSKHTDHKATKQRLQMILDYIASKAQQAQQKTNDVIKNDAHFQTELKRTALLEAIMPYYETQKNTFWVEP